MQSELVAELSAGSGELLHPGESAGLGGDGKDVGMLAIVAEPGPAGEDEVEAGDTVRLQFAHLTGALGEGVNHVVRIGFALGNFCGSELFEQTALREDIA